MGMGCETNSCVVGDSLGGSRGIGNRHKNGQGNPCPARKHINEKNITVSTDGLLHSWPQ